MIHGIPSILHLPVLPVRGFPETAEMTECRSAAEFRRDIAAAEAAHEAIRAAGAREQRVLAEGEQDAPLITEGPALT